MSGVNLAVGQCSQEGSQGSVSVPDPWSVSQPQVLESGQTVEIRETRAADGGTTTQLQLQEGAPDVSQVNEAFVTKILAVGKVQTIHSLETNYIGSGELHNQRTMVPFKQRNNVESIILYSI